MIKWGQQAIIIHRPSLSEMAGWGLQQYLKHVYMPCLASSVLTCPKLKYPTLIPEKCVASLSFLPGSSSPKRSVVMSKTARVGLSTPASCGLPQMNSCPAPDVHLLGAARVRVRTQVGKAWARVNETCPRYNTGVSCQLPFRALLGSCTGGKKR